jgi:hypothetical protein
VAELPEFVGDTQGSDQAMTAITEWISAHRSLLEWLGVASLVLLVVTVVVMPIVIINLPEDYFIRDRRESVVGSGRSPWWAAMALVKNGIGILLILSGLAMLVLPGQGVLTILFGVALTNFPGKYRLERRIVNSPAVCGALDKIRSAAGRQPLRLS